MKAKILALLLAATLVISLTPVFGVDTGTGIGIDIEPEEFPVHIWMCDDRVFYEDCVEEGRETNCGQQGLERINNYAFEGEQITWTVLVMDKNKIEEVQEVVGTIGDTQGTGNDIEVECQRVTGNIGEGNELPRSCSARILEEELRYFDEQTMAFYDCKFTVETPESMQGEHFLTVEAISADSEAIMDENEFWFLNPIIALSVDGDVQFENVRPGAVAYSSTLRVGNDAEDGSGVLLDMFISGTDFYDPDSSGAKCPVTNQLKLSNDNRSPAAVEVTGKGTSSAVTHVNTDCQAGTLGLTDHNADHLCYYATNGAYSTAGASNADVEGYVPIVYGDAFSRNFYNDAEIIRNPGTGSSGLLDINGIDYHAGNTLTPGAEIALNFKLGLPEPCVGNFNEGDIFFWGEAI